MLLAAGWLLGGMTVGGIFLCNLRNQAVESAVGPPIRTLNEEVLGWFGCLQPPFLELEELCDDDGNDRSIEMNEMDLRRLAFSEEGGLIQQKRFPDLPEPSSGLTPRTDW